MCQHVYSRSNVGQVMLKVVLLLLSSKRCHKSVQTYKIIATSVGLQDVIRLAWTGIHSSEWCRAFCTDAAFGSLPQPYVSESDLA